MCACHGLEQWGRTRETFCKPFNGLPFNTPSVRSAVHNKAVHTKLRKEEITRLRLWP
jgi:hypothetical protein